MKFGKLLPFILYTLCFAGLFFSAVAIFESMTGGVCGENCASVMSSAYSKVFGIPVGCFSFCVWLYLIQAIRKPTKIDILLSSLLGLGALSFICILVFVLYANCIICLLHNSTAILAAFCFPFALYKRSTKTRYPVFLLTLEKLAIAIPVFCCLASIARNAEPIEGVKTNNNLYVNFPILYSQGALPSQQNIAVVSLDCPHCYKLLAKLLTFKYPKPTYLNIVLKNTPETAEANQKTLAAILKLVADGKFLQSQTTFQAVFPIIFKHSKEMEKGNFLPYLQELDEIVPNSSKYNSLATFILNSYTLFYSELKTQQTPLFIKDGNVVKDVLKMHP